MAAVEIAACARVVLIRHLDDHGVVDVAHATLHRVIHRLPLDLPPGPQQAAEAAHEGTGLRGTAGGPPPPAPPPRPPRGPRPRPTRVTAVVTPEIQPLGE